MGEEQGMLTHHIKWLSNAFILLIFHSLSSFAAEPELEALSKPTATEPLPLGTLLDSEGNHSRSRLNKAP